MTYAANNRFKTYRTGYKYIKAFYIKLRVIIIICILVKKPLYMGEFITLIGDNIYQNQIHTKVG